MIHHTFSFTVLRFVDSTTNLGRDFAITLVPPHPKKKKERNVNLFKLNVRENAIIPRLFGNWSPGNLMPRKISFSLFATFNYEKHRTKVDTGTSPLKFFALRDRSRIFRAIIYSSVRYSFCSTCRNGYFSSNPVEGREDYRLDEKMSGTWCWGIKKGGYCLWNGYRWRDI